MKLISSTKKGPCRMHGAPLRDDVRSDKKRTPRFISGAKLMRKAANKTLTLK